MKKNALLLFLFVCIIGTLPHPLVSGAGWLDGWSNRDGFVITGSVGAGTNYQISFAITYDPIMQNDFEDLRFTAYDGVTEYDYWIETYSDSTSATVWVEWRDDLGSDSSGWMYYGNNGVNTTSNGTNTFIFFDDFENDNLNRWTTTEDNWATQAGTVKMGSFAGFGDADATGRILSTTLISEIDYDIMVHAWTRVSDVTGTMYNLHGVESDTGTIYLAATKTNDVGTNQGGWLYYVEDEITKDVWFRYEVAIDFTDTELQFWLDRVVKTTRPLKDSANAVVVDIEKVQSVTSATAGDDQYLDDVYIRKWLNTEPSYQWGEWVENHEVDLIFVLGWDPTFQFGYDAFFIFAGLIMIPLSTMYLVRGGRKGMSMNKLFYGLLIFMIGFGLLVGGIMP